MTGRYQERDPFASDAFKSIQEFVESAAVDGKMGFEGYERELHRRMMAFESELTARHLEQYDVEAEEIEVFGEKFRRKGSYEKTYYGLSGELIVDRAIYVPRSGVGRSIVPLELRVGMVEGTWTPLAARVMARTVASTTPKEAAEIFKEFGGLTPSTSAATPSGGVANSATSCPATWSSLPQASRASPGART